MPDKVDVDRAQRKELIPPHSAARACHAPCAWSVATPGLESQPIRALTLQSLSTEPGPKLTSIHLVVAELLHREAILNQIGATSAFVLSLVY